MFRCILRPRCPVRGLETTRWDTFCNLPGMIGFWLTHADIHFEPSLAYEGFDQHMLRSIFCIAGMEWVWSTHVEIHFVASLALDKFGQYMLRYTLCHGWHKTGLINACWDAFSVLPLIGWVSSTHVEIFFVLSVIGWIWLTRIEMHFVGGFSVN